MGASCNTPTVVTIGLDNVREALADFEPEMFTSRMILERVPWIFQSSDQFLEWKKELADGLKVDPHSIIIVGSACTGVTLNPKKEPFRVFGEDSDVDVAIISPHHFDIAWAALRDIGRVGGTIPTRSEQKMRKMHKEYLVFNGTIATDKILEYLPFGVEWRLVLDQAANREPTVGHEVKARIYRNIESLRLYHERNVADLRATHTKDMRVSLTQATDTSDVTPLNSTDIEEDLSSLMGIPEISNGKQMTK